MRRECRKRFRRHGFQRNPLVSDYGLHHGTCAMYVPWCMSESLTRGGGENVPGILGACATDNFTYLARGPYILVSAPHLEIRSSTHGRTNLERYAFAIQIKKTSKRIRRAISLCFYFSRTFFEKTRLNSLLWNSLLSRLPSQLGYSAGLFST